MGDQQKPITVQKEHLKRGIEKYKGKINTHIQKLINAADLDYEPYEFEDGRILLILPNWQYGILYPDQDSLYEHLQLE